MDEPLLVRVVQAPGELDGGVEDGVEGDQLPVADRVPERAAVHEFREDARDPLQAPHVVAGHHVGVEREVDPRLRLALERFDAAGGVQRLLERHLDREVDAPAAVMDTIHAAHAALAEESRHLVQAEDDVARLPFARSTHRRRRLRHRRQRGRGRRGDGGRFHDGGDRRRG
jgi:hypothetical protein